MEPERIEMGTAASANRPRCAAAGGNHTPTGYGALRCETMEADVKKWTSTAGPCQTKAVSKAARDLLWNGQSCVEITGTVGQPETESRCTLTNLFGGVAEDFLEAYRAIGERFGWQITRENHKAIIEAYEAETKRLPLPEVDKRTTPEQITERDQKNDKIRDERDRKAAEKAAKVDELVAEMRERYPWAKPEGKLSPHARAAANIREELRRAFPGVKFRVRSDSFSMGNSVDVGWRMGPTTEQVTAITGKYQHGHFDGMEDMYRDDNSAESRAVSVVLGQTKYVQTSRSLDDDTHELIGRALCEAQGIEFGMDARNLYGQGDYQDTVSDHVYRLMNDTAFPVGAVITGVESDNSNEWRHCYRVTFDVPEATPAPTDGDGYEIQKHHHTKKGFDMWLVVLADRVERETFCELRDSCKVAGGWYSRKWSTTPGGFAFNSEEDAQAWAESTLTAQAA